MTKKYNRRESLLIAGAALTTFAATAAKPTLAQSNAAPYTMKPLPFDPARIPGLSERLLASHYQNNYGGAVRRLNAIQVQLAALDFTSAPNFVVNGLKREELIATNSMILHEHYFESLGDGALTGPLADAVARDFGSVGRWRNEFSAMGKAQGGGSGWTILVYSPRDRRLLNVWAMDHTTILADGRPILALDMYEHSYHMDFGANAAAYVDSFMNAIAWDRVGAKFTRIAQQA